MNAITSATLCCLGLALASGPAWAETLVYDPVGGTTDPSTFGPFFNSKNSHWGNGAYVYSGSLVPPTIDKNGYNITIKSTSPGSHLTTFAGAYGHGAVDIAGNRLSIENNTTEALAFAGFNTSNNVSHNALTVSGGKLSAAHGGYVSEKGHAIGNRATFSGGSIVHGLHGGLTYKGDANNNTVTILDQAAPSAHYVVGGKSWSEGNANGNTVNMSGGKINQNIEGGASFTKGHADGNSVTVSGGTVGNYIYGGINRDYLHSGNANKNTVTVSGGTVGAVIGGSAWGDADGNSVTVSGGKVLQIIGGRSLSNDTSASSNTVTVSGGKIEGSIVGGEAATALNNVVNILGAPVIGGGIRGNASNGEAAEISGNTLNIATKGLRLTKPIENFEWINFYLPSHIAANDTVVTISDELRAKHSKLGVAMQDGGVLAHGDKVTLVDASGGLGWISEFPQDLSNHFNHPANTRKLSAMTLDTQYEFTLSEGGKKIVATALIAASKPSPNPAPAPAPAKPHIAAPVIQIQTAPTRPPQHTLSSTQPAVPPTKPIQQPQQQTTVRKQQLRPPQPIPSTPSVARQKPTITPQVLPSSNPVAPQPPKQPSTQQTVPTPSSPPKQQPTTTTPIQTSTIRRQNIPLSALERSPEAYLSRKQPMVRR